MPPQLFQGKRFFLVLIITTLLLSLAATVALTIRPFGAFETRRKAAEIEIKTIGSTLSFSGPKQVKVGEKFSVDLVLDTTGDPNYTISGVDAVVSFANSPPISPTIIQSTPAVTPSEEVLQNKNLLMPPLRQSISLINITHGKIFDSYPGYPGAPCGGIAGLKCQEGYYCSYGGGAAREIKPDEMGTCIPDYLLLPQVQIASASTSIDLSKLLTVTPGTPDAQMTIDINNPSYIGKIPSFQNQFTVSGIKNYGVDENGNFKGFSGKGVFATLNFIANEAGNADIKIIYNGQQATDDTNINGYLANQPVAGQKTQERLITAPLPYVIEVVKEATPTSPVSYIYECGACGLLLPPASQGGPSGAAQCAPGLVCRGSNDDNPYAGASITRCVKADGASQCGFTEGPEGPTPTPAVTVDAVINFKLALADRTNHATPVDIYGMKVADAIILNTIEFSRANSIKLGSTTTDEKGYGKLILNPSYIGRKYILFAETPSHLRKAAQNNQPIMIQAGDNPKCAELSTFCPEDGKYVSFGNLTAGDIYVDANGNKDNLINSFDVAELFSSWSLVGEEDKAKIAKLEAADLNSDGVINNRDLVIIFKNFGKKGDRNFIGDPIPPPVVQ